MEKTPYDKWVDAMFERLGYFGGIIGGIEYIVDSDMSDAVKVSRIREVLEMKNRIEKEQAPYEVPKP